MIYWNDFDFNSLPDIEAIKGSKQIWYLNSDFAVDIETSSFYHEGQKRAYPYIMMVNICGNIIYCRYLSELYEIFQKIKRRYFLSNRRRIIMFVHNLSYEFQFFRDICNFTEVFARTRLKPMKCFDSNSCIEFHCSYTISGLSLSNLAKNLKTVKIEKLNGDEYNYKLLRHSETPLTELEMKYCEHDVMILHYWIQEEIAKNDGKITKIPLTQTGYIRRECRQYIFDNCDKGKYKYMIKKATPNTDCFICLHKAFAGGDTHGNYIHIKQVLENVGSFDFASSYPAVMVKCKYPREFKKLKVISTRMFENLLSTKACVFKIAFDEVKAKRHHHTLSLSKCETYEKGSVVVDNGRIVEGKKITTYMTDIDYKDFTEFYDFKGRQLIEFYYSDYQYLPKPFIEYILELFKNKTELKDLKGELEEALYMKSKQHINGLYGMCVTNIVNDNAVFTDKWEEYKNLSLDEEFKHITEILDEYRNAFGSFLLYQWGVWVTSWARHFLRQTIAKIEDNSSELDGFAYCDTDSVKIQGYEEHMEIIKEYNKQNEIDMRKAMEYHGIDINAFKAKTIKGKTKVLGNWEFEGVYRHFKTLGAKRYMYTTKVATSQPNYKEVKTLKLEKFKHKWHHVDWHLTVAGLNKNKAMPYILKHGAFDFFNKGMRIPPDYTGKSTHTYIDEYYNIDVIDYLGNVSNCQATHYIHLQEQEYNLSIAKQFEKFLSGTTISGEPIENRMKLLRTGAMATGGRII